MNKTILISGLDNIEEAAGEFLMKKPANMVVALYGEMGAGKTTFTKALCKVLGVVDGVNSPTFNLINEYRTDKGEVVYHFDFYRINKLEEAFDIGFEEFIESGNLCIIEWPEKIELILPSDTLRVKISVLKDGSRELAF
ncbi:MAG: tRNA (adenosine(37)-N6)-threonylcarbamoyltransferase complex ATPase subunit type 1 TsaE [Bacteroidales bacterium]